MNSSLPNPTDKHFVIRATDILESLLCINYLICWEADDPDKVRNYANMADERTKALRELLRPMLWPVVSQDAVV
jgi:hypothetical protein